MKRLAPLAVVLAAALSVSAAAQPPPSAPSAPRPRPACFWQSSITNFAASDTSRLYLRASARRVFELTMFSNCLQLNWVHRLSIRTRGTSTNICEGPNPPVDVFVRDSGIPGGQRCAVTNIRLLTPEEVAALPPDARP